MRHAARSGRIILQVILVLTIAIVAMCAAFFTARLGPQKLDRNRTDSVQVQREAEAWKSRSRELWERFEILFSHHNSNWEKLTDADRATLREALELREKYVAQTRGDPEMLIDPIRKRWAEIHAEECRAKSVEVEKRANAARDAKDFAEAEKLYAEARAFEQEILEKYDASGMRDQAFLRSAVLREEIRRAAGQPVWAESVRCEETGGKLAGEGEKLLQAGNFAEAVKKWTQAREQYARALETELEITAKYNGIFDIRTSRAGRALDLRIKLDTLASREEHERLQRLIASAAKAIADGNYDTAEKTWTEVIERYESMYQRNFRSEYVSKEEKAKRATLRDHHLSKPHYAALRQRASELDVALRAGRVEGIPGAALLILGEEALLKKKYPDAPLLDLATGAKLRCLSEHTGDIAFVQNRIREMLRPVPGHPGVLLLATEMPQSLHVLILGGKQLNPSANSGDLLPVDSVSYAEAVECCRHLGWLMGMRVRLPTETEMRAAAGVPDRATLGTRAWSFENSDDKSHNVGAKPANEHGFHDLLGNLSEWTHAADTDANAKEFGGNYSNSLDTLATVPVAPRPKRDKSRLRGFRILLEKTPPPPATAPAK